MSTRIVACVPIAALAVVLALPVPGGAQTDGASTMRVSVRDATDLALPHAEVVLVDAQGTERQVPADAQGIATFAGLQPGEYVLKVSAEGFQPVTRPLTVPRGTTRTIVTLVVAVSETLDVVDQGGGEDRQGHGFTQTLTQDEIDALSDDPDEMAEQLMEMAGPGAQIFVDGFRGGRLPPKDQIQQIRFNTNSFSAEYHEAGLVRVEVITRPGQGGWRGRANAGFRDESLNARNAFAASKEPMQQQRYGFSFQGPLVKGRTGLSLSVDGYDAYDSSTILVQTPAGGFASGVARNTTSGLNASFRVEHALSATSQVRAEYERRSSNRANLGVGEFDLPERAYDNERTTDTFRLRNTRVLGKKVFSELKFSLVGSSAVTDPLSTLPTVRVNGAFTAGGAGQSGESRSREIELAQNVDFGIGRRHALRAGVLLEAGWWDSTQAQNANGTYLFTSQDAYNLGQPATYTIRVGDPLVAYSQVKAGWFLQDDVRVGRSLSVSVGLRQEVQTQVADRWNLAPRGGFTWSATRGTTVRGGYGIFYDWYESNLYEQTLRVDGERQVDLIVEQPTFPVGGGTGSPLPGSVIRAASLAQPTIQQGSIGVERELTSWAGLRADYLWTRASSVFRSVNVNAPVDGVRPEPDRGNISEVQSTGRRASDRLTLAVNARNPRLRLFTHASYQWQRTRDHADSATSLPSDSTHPDADWGPSAQDVRHRLFVMFNTPLIYGLRAGLHLQASSARPYTITTGLDANGDTVFNDRPAGLARNSARGARQVNANLRVNRTFGFGGAGSGPGGPPMVPPHGDGALAQRGPGGGPGGPGGDGPQMVVMEGMNARYRLDVFAQISNLFNAVNYNTFVGNQLSPFFGQATSAGPPRRVEVGVSLGF